VDYSATQGRGANFGWKCYEGSLPNDGTFPPCIPLGHVPPVFEYDKPGCQAITGGYVVRDPGLPSLLGRYVYADYCDGRSARSCRARAPATRPRASTSRAAPRSMSRQRSPPRATPHACESAHRVRDAMATLRYAIPEDQASLTLEEAGGALTALFALDAHTQHHLKWLAEAAEAFGKPPHLDDEQTKDARAAANAQTERMRALRTDLAELAADAEAQLPAGEAKRADIVQDHEMPLLPDTLGPNELVMVERSFSAGMARYVHSASISLRPLRSRLQGFGDEESSQLAARVAAFLAAVHG
jgi:hypothetical protein